MSWLLSYSPSHSVTDEYYMCVSSGLQEFSPGLYMVVFILSNIYTSKGFLLPIICVILLLFFKCCLVTIRVVLTLAISHSSSFREIGVNDEFLQSLHWISLDVTTSSFSITTPLRCNLRKTVYGLKQVPRAWYDKLSCFLHYLGFKTSKANASLGRHYSLHLLQYSHVCGWYNYHGKFNKYIDQIIQHLNIALYLNKTTSVSIWNENKTTSLLFPNIW